MRRIHFLGIDIYGCKEALERLDDYIDSELPPDETRKVAQHLRICIHCTHKFRFEQELIGGVRTKLLYLSTPDEVDNLRHKVNIALENERRNRS